MCLRSSKEGGVGGAVLTELAVLKQCVTNSWGNRTGPHLKPPAQFCGNHLLTIPSENVPISQRCFLMSGAMQPDIIYLMTILCFQRMPVAPPLCMYCWPFPSRSSATPWSLSCVFSNRTMKRWISALTKKICCDFLWRLIWFCKLGFAWDIPHCLSNKYN